MNESQLGDHILLGIVGHRYYIIIPEVVYVNFASIIIHIIKSCTSGIIILPGIANTLAYSTLWHSHIILSMKYMYESAGVLQFPHYNNITTLLVVI